MSDQNDRMKDPTFVTQLQLTKSLEDVQDKLTNQFSAGFERVLNKLDAVQSHTDNKIDTEVTAMHKRIDAERAIQREAVDKLREERRIGYPVIIGVTAVVIGIIGGLGRWMQVTSSLVNEQAAVVKAVAPYEERFKDSVFNLIETEDRRNDLHDSTLAKQSAELSNLDRSLRDSIQERKELEVRMENHVDRSRRQDVLLAELHGMIKRIDERSVDELQH